MFIVVEFLSILSLTSTQEAQFSRQSGKSFEAESIFFRSTKCSYELGFGASVLASVRMYSVVYLSLVHFTLYLQSKQTVRWRWVLIPDIFHCYRINGR